MRQLLIFVFFFLTFSLYSCSMLFNAYIRNTTNEIAIIDVFLLDKIKMTSLPNKVKLANRIVIFKSGYKKYIDGTQNVIWLDLEHFKFEIDPNTTVDLTDMAGKFLNSFPMGDVIVTVTTNNRIDTLLNGGSDFRYGLFGYKKIRFGSPILFFDIK